MTDEIKKDSEQIDVNIPDTTKEMADKAENVVEDATEKVEESSFFRKAGAIWDKIDEFVEDKLEDLEKSDIKDKLSSFADKVEDKAEELIEKAKVASKNISEKAEDVVEDLKDKFKGKDEAPKV